MGKIVKGKWMELGAPFKAAKKKRTDTECAALVYQLKVVLKGSKPPIWRRLRVSGGTTLNALHSILQTAMGWEDCHLHQFEIDGEYYAPSASEMDETQSEAGLRLYQAARKPKAKFLYEYDMGDGWAHAITVEKILPPDPEQKLPECIAGAGACPPEDCGGLWGYYAILDAVEDPDHADHEEMKEWLDDNFDPNAFDAAKVNAMLQR